MDSHEEEILASARAIVGEMAALSQKTPDTPHGQISMLAMRIEEEKIGIMMRFHVLFNACDGHLQAQVTDIVRQSTMAQSDKFMLSPILSLE